MYSSKLNTTNKGTALSAAVGLQAALLLALMRIAPDLYAGHSQPPLQLTSIPLEARPFHIQQPQRHIHAKHLDAGGSAPQKIVSKTIALVLPRPIVTPPANDTLDATKTARATTGSTVGISQLSGSGSGSAGRASGNGIGNRNGSGEGDGVAEPPHLASPVLSGYDFPREIVSQWPRAATVFLRLRIDERGYVSECLLDRGTNIPAIDREMCNTVHERLRFRPALDQSGGAIAGWFGYAQPAPR